MRHCCTESRVYRKLCCKFGLLFQSSEDVMKPKMTTGVDRLVGGKIRAFRKAKGWTQTNLGTALGVSFQQVQKYENGSNRVGSGRLVEIARLLDVPITGFFDDRKPKGSGHIELADLLSDPQTVRLVKAFSNLGDRALQRRILNLAQAISAQSKRR